jgi:hypothetical protein
VIGLIKGARVRLTIKTKRETRTFTASVTGAEQRSEGTYFGYRPDDVMKNGQWGYAMWRKEPTPYGLVALEVLS